MDSLKDLGFSTAKQFSWLMNGDYPYPDGYGYVLPKRVFPVGPESEQMFVVHLQKDEIDREAIEGIWLLFSYAGGSVRLLDRVEDPTGEYVTNYGFFSDTNGWQQVPPETFFKLNDKYSVVVYEREIEVGPYDSYWYMQATLVSVDNGKLSLSASTHELLGTNYNLGWIFWGGGTSQLMPFRVSDTEFEVHYYVEPHPFVHGATVIGKSRFWVSSAGIITETSRSSVPFADGSVGLPWCFANGRDPSDGYYHIKRTPEDNNSNNLWIADSNYENVRRVWPATADGRFMMHYTHGRYMSRDGNLVPYAFTSNQVGYNYSIGIKGDYESITHLPDPSYTTARQYGGSQGTLSPGYLLTAVLDSYKPILTYFEDDGDQITDRKVYDLSSHWTHPDEGPVQYTTFVIFREIYPGVNVFVTSHSYDWLNDMGVLVLDRSTFIAGRSRSQRLSFSHVTR